MYEYVSEALRGQPSTIGTQPERTRIPGEARNIH